MFLAINLGNALIEIQKNTSNEVHILNWPKTCEQCDSNFFSAFKHATGRATFLFFFFWYEVIPFLLYAQLVYLNKYTNRINVCWIEMQNISKQFIITAQHWNIYAVQMAMNSTESVTPLQLENIKKEIAAFLHSNKMEKGQGKNRRMYLFIMRKIHRRLHFKIHSHRCLAHFFVCVFK